MLSKLKFISSIVDRFDSQVIMILIYVFRSKQQIKDAILDNDFLKNLDSTQIREIVDCMYSKSVKKGSFIIKEGEPGSHLYVASGRYLFMISKQIELCSKFLFDLAVSCQSRGN